MKKRDNIIYRISTALISLMMLGGAAQYIFNHDEVTSWFEALGYPAHLVYPLAIAKILGVVALWLNKAKLKEWAYAGFTFDFSLAVMAHLHAEDGEFYGALMALALLAVSYVFKTRVEAKAKS